MTVGGDADAEVAAATGSETNDEADGSGVGTKPDLRPEPGSPPEAGSSPEADAQAEADTRTEDAQDGRAESDEQTEPGEKAASDEQAAPDEQAGSGEQAEEDEQAEADARAAAETRPDTPSWAETRPDSLLKPETPSEPETPSKPDTPPKADVPREPRPQPGIPPETPARPTTGTGPFAGARVPAPSATWHRLHYAVGVFLVAYGVTGLLSTVLMWGDRQDEAEVYLGALPASAVLVLVKLIEVALVASAAAGLALRRDALLVPPVVGWMAGFATFAVLDVFTGQWGKLGEHALYLAAFVALLFLSYGLSTKVQLARAAEGDTAQDGAAEPDERRPSGAQSLNRLQKLAVQTLDRIPRP